MTPLRAWLGRPLGWFTFVLAEYVITIALLRAVLPARLTTALGVIVLAVTVVGLFAFNLWLRRWLARPDRET